MRKKWSILIILGMCLDVAIAADTELQDLTELTAIAGSDVLYVVDDPAGTPASRKITATNLFDMIDTSNELLTILTDETGEGVAVFGTNPTLTGATLAGVLADNDDMVFEADADNDGSNKFSFTDGTSAEVASISEAGLLSVLVGIDAIGNVDFDIGSADVDDVTVITDGGTWILDDTFTFPDADTSPDAVGELVYDNTVTGFLGGLFAWYDDDEVRYIVDVNATNLPGVAEDDYVLAYDKDDDEYYFKADADSGSATAWDDITIPDANDTLDFGAYEIALDVNDFWVGAVDSGNYIKFSGNSMSFVGTGDIDLPADAVDSTDIGTNQVQLDALDVSDVSDDIAGDIAYGELTDNSIGAADVNDIACGTNVTWDDTNDEIDVDDAFILNTGDIGTGVYDFGGADSFEIPNADAPTVDAIGEIALDTAITDHNDLLTYFDSESGAFFVIAMPTGNLATNDDYVVSYDATNDYFYMKADATGGTTAYDDIGDPDAAGSISFDDGETATYTGANLDEDFFTINLSAADLTSDVNALVISAVDNDDTNFIPFLIQDDSGGTPDDLFKIDSTGTITTGIFNAGAVTSSGTIEGATLTEGGVAVYNDDEMDTEAELEGILTDVTDMYTDGEEDTIAAAISAGALTNDSVLFADLDDDGNYGPFTGAWDFTGGSLELPNSADPDLTTDAMGTVSIDTDGGNEPNSVTMRTIEGDDQYLLADSLISIQCTIVNPQDMDDAERDQCPIWYNTKGMTFYITEIWAWAPDDDTDVNLEIVSETDFSTPSTLEALVIADNGTSVFSETVAKADIDDNTVAAGEHIVADFDDTDDPGFVKICITGYFDANIN